MNQKIYLVFLLLLMMNCSRYVYETSYTIRPENQKKVDEHWEELVTKKTAPKIALFGFHTYRVASKDSSLLTKETYAEVDYQSQTYKFFKNGKYIDQAITDKIIPVDASDVKRFVIEYLRVTEASGKSEIEKILVPAKGKKDKFALRKIDADYIVMAVHLPYYHERTKSAINAITGFFGIITLGLVPIYEESKAETFFIVFDKNLKYQNSFYYSRPYTIVSAIWMWPNEGLQTFFTQDEVPPANAYKIHVEEFEREMLYQLTLKVK
ncbi:hypothetical protein JWG40_18340 [Leptospira sp. 201903074]|uniref:Lp29 family lipoprotein n=1 Tax=Leptospira abararensis TaxID=2810036 RepID=UPI001962D6D6|nr:hypothetical protein [Leptospira abararensis]MBM9548993.1 hypothetical protein [Leptospira abararensis]